MKLKSLPKIERPREKLDPRLRLHPPKATEVAPEAQRSLTG